MKKYEKHLISEQLTTFQLHRMLLRNRDTSKYYRGTFPSDLLPRCGFVLSRNPSLIIVNHAKSESPGTHWSLLFFPHNSMNNGIPYYFDSFGRNPNYQVDIFNFMRKNGLEISYNRSRLQHFDSNSCGYFVLVVAWLLSRGVNPNNISDHFNQENPADNDTLLRKIVKKHFEHT